MNTTIYVFSGTGTSLAMATNICNAIENTEIISIPHLLKSAGEDEIKIESSKIGYDIDKSSYFLYKISRLLSPKSIARDTRTWDIEFSANEKCNKCGICSKVCPVNNIKMVNQKPEFQHNCQRCMACIQYCPSNAISFKGKSLNKQKYYHPDFPAKKMIEFNN